MAKSVEELKVWQRSNELNVAVTAIIGNAGFRRDRRLKDQIVDAADSIVSNIAEGFEQPTDRAFARYLYISKASNGEVRARLHIARNRRDIDDHEFQPCYRLSVEVGKMLTEFIKYLTKSDRRNRGLGSSDDD